MRAHEVDLMTLIQGTKQFLVPLYQRPYSWGDDQLGQLWTDILAEAERVREGDQGSGHFVGSVVLAPSPHAHAAGDGLAQWLVVDGQQRLTTLLVLLAAIRDHVRDTDPETAGRIDFEYLTNQFRKGDERLRLLPTQADRDDFRACVLRLPGAEVTGGIGSAYRRFQANLVAFDDPDDPNDVARVEQVVRQRLRLVEITAELGDNVHRIFQSLNNTGLKLSQADLLRNHLFMLLPNRGEQVYGDVWLPMQKSLGSELEMLVWLDLVLRGDDKVKQAEVYRAQADRLRSTEQDEDRIAAEIVEFSRRSAHLQLLLRPAEEKDEEVRAALKRLNEWGGQAAYPAAMLLLDRRDQGRLGPAQVAEGLLIIESFLVRRMIAGVPTNNLNRILNAVPRDIGSADDPVAALRDYLSGTRRFWPSDAEIQEKVRTDPFYWYGRGPQRSYVLRRLENSYDAPEPVDWDRAKATVEHLMPQSLTEAWRADLADEAAAEGLTVFELHGTLVHTLGNLTLSALNGRLGNHPFSKKKEILRAGALAMNREILDAPRWGRAEILARADRLADRIIRLWPGPARAQAPTGSRDWTRLHQAMALVPPGAWTTYGDLAELIGSHPVPVGVHLANEAVPNAWRALTVDGRPSGRFQWRPPGRPESQRQVLEHEGVTFDSVGRAATEQRLSGADLARLVGLQVPDEMPAVGSEEESDDRLLRFFEQLDAAQDEPTALGVREAMTHWEGLGGYLSLGAASQTTCFLMLERDEGDIWPLAIYPVGGAVEVVFQHLSRRPPFDDPSLRRELMDRLNQIDGIRLAEAKLAMRPSFPAAVLAEKANIDKLNAVLFWFAATCGVAEPQSDDQTEEGS